MRRLLAIDTSGPTLGLAALADGALVEHIEEPEAARHVETIVPLLDTLLKRCAWDDTPVEAIAVAEGPGSFTGLRVGMAAAKALALAHDAAVISVRTLEAWAITELFLRGGVEPVERGGPRSDASLIVPVLDARKRRFYTAAFRAAPPSEDACVRRVTEDRDVPAAELIAMVARTAVDGESWCAPGPPSREVSASLGAGPATAAGGSAAIGVALWGYRLADAGTVDDPYHGPFYLREGDIGSRRVRPVFEEAPRRDTAE